MRENPPLDFGLIVAYLVPGFVALWGLSLHSPTIESWLAVAPSRAATVGDMFYATLASLALGMIVSAFRWALIDALHHCTGIPMPDWDFSLLERRLAGYRLLVEFHYRYFQFFANMLVASVFTYLAVRLAGRDVPLTADLALVIVCFVLFLTSRDALRKYYARAGALLSTDERRCDMANGGDKTHHPAPKGAEAKAADEARKGTAQQPKPQSAAKPRTK